MSRLAFLSPHEADVAPVSPVLHVSGSAFVDRSSLGKLEVRGDVSKLDVSGSSWTIPISSTQTSATGSRPPATASTT